MVRVSSASSSPSSPSTVTTANHLNDATPEQIGKAFVVQYYRLLHEHPESLYRFYSSTSTFMHDDPNKTVTGIENIAKHIEELSLKDRHVKIRQVDCHSTVGASVVVQVCGEISSLSLTGDPSSTMKRFVQTFVLAPTIDAKQKYYVHNDIFRYQDNDLSTSITDSTNTKILSPTKNDDNEVDLFGIVLDKSTSTLPVQTSAEVSFSVNIKFSDDSITEREEKLETNTNTAVNTKHHAKANNQQEETAEKQQSSKPKSYRDAIEKRQKLVPVTTANNQSESKSTKNGLNTAKSVKQKPSKSSNRSARATRGHPQDTNDYYDDAWYNAIGEEAYLHTGYTDDQEIFIGNLSAQVTEQEIHELFRPYGCLLLVRIGNTGSQVGAANFAFVVCQSIEMAKAIVADHDSLLQSQHVNVEAKKRRPFPHTFRPTYPTAACPTNYQSTGYPALFYEQSSLTSFYNGGTSAYGTSRNGKKGAY